MTESALDRKLGRFTLEQICYAILLAVALFLRLYLLQQKPQHHDESIHAFFSWKITQDGVADYKYDPVYHGPILYYSTALMFLLFGDSDFTSRLSAVAFGMGVLFFAWPLRRYLGRWGALTFLVLLTFSPAFVYFTRFLRHDIYMALGNLGAVYWIFRYAETRQARYMYWSAGSLAIAYATKEDMYLMVPVMLLCFAGMLLWEVLAAEDSRRARREAWAEAKSFFAGAAIPLLTSAIIFVIISLTLYTSLFTHGENWNPVGRALSYWWGQQQIKRIGGPWWYYMPQLALYEPLLIAPFAVILFGPVVWQPARTRLGRYLRYAAAVAFGLFALSFSIWPEHPGVVLAAALILTAAALATSWVPDRFTRFAILWAIGTLCIYSWAQEKVPWLLVPQVLPLALAVGRWFGSRIEAGATLGPGTIVPVAGVAGITLWSMVAVNYLYDAPRPNEPKESRHAELLVYVQSTYGVIDVMRKIEDVADTLGTGLQTRLAVSGNATWPLSWYLRHYPVNWAADVRNVDTPVVIIDREVNALDKALAESYTREEFEIRGWWEPDWKRLNLPKLWRWLLTREAWNGNGSSDGLIFVHKNLVPGMAFQPIAVNPPPAARGYPKNPEFVSGEAAWGQQGTAPGQFNEPRGIAVAADGSVYVVDSKNNRVQKFAADGKPLTAWGREGNGRGEFKDPGGMAVAPDGSVYVADTWNHRIQKFDAGGRYLIEWTEENPGFWGPRGVAVAPDGTVYVTDTGNKRVLAYNSQGARLHVWGKEGSQKGEFIEPVGIAVDGSGRVVVADTGNRRLQFFDAQGAFVEEWPVFGWDEFYTEPYIAAAGAQVYVTDSYNHRFARYAGGKFAGTWGKTGAGRGDFNRPIGIAVDAAGAVYVSDTLNHRVQKFAPLPE